MGFHSTKLVVICYGSAGTLMQPWAAAVGPAVSTPTVCTSDLAPGRPIHPHTGNSHTIISSQTAPRTPGFRLPSQHPSLKPNTIDLMLAVSQTVQLVPVPPPSRPSPTVPIPEKGPTFTVRHKTNFGVTLVHITWQNLPSQGSKNTQSGACLPTLPSYPGVPRFFSNETVQGLLPPLPQCLLVSEMPLMTSCPRSQSASLSPQLEYNLGMDGHLRLECLSHRAAARMSQRRREPLLLL